MKRTCRIPEVGKNEFQDIDFANHEMTETEKRYARLHMREMMMTEEQRISPDTYRCECIFLKRFVNDDMEWEFPLIAKDFLQHEMKNLEKYTELEFLDADPIGEWPEASFRDMILNLMMGAVREGNEYARNLFCYLHKTYYRQEYKVLKRFRRMTAREIVDIATDGKHRITDFDVARVLCISRMYGIELDKDCVFLYLLLDEQYENIFWDDKDFFNLPAGSMNEAAEEITELFGDGMDMIDALDRDETFSRKVLSYFCCTEDYLDLCDDENYGAEDTLTRTLAFLKICFPKREFSKEEILAYAQAYHAISALQSVCSNMHGLVKETLGIKKGDSFDDCNVKFKPEQIKGQPVVKVPEKADCVRKSDRGSIKNPAINMQPDSDMNEQLLQELEQLRSKLHLQENTTRELQKQLRDTRRKLAEQEELSHHHEEERKELSVLRDYLYHLTEGMEQEPDIPYEAMMEHIADLDIMIVGGNDNWVKKLRNMFPKWRFLSPNASAAVSSMQTAKIDKAYFFTDTLGHSQYYKYMQVIRNRQISFGFIHGVNIQANVQQIYQDFTE